MTQIVVKVGAETVDKLIVRKAADSPCGHENCALLNVMTEDEAFGIIGTLNDVIEFGAAFMGAAFQWAVNNGKADWLSDINPLTPMEDCEYGKPAEE